MDNRSVTVLHLNDDTISLLDEQSEFEEGCLTVGPLRTPVKVEKGIFQNVSKLEILPGTEPFNIGRILSGCSTLKEFSVENLEKDGMTRIFGGRSSFKNEIWQNLTSLELLLTNPSPSYSNTVALIKYKRFPCLIELKFTCRVPHRTKLSEYLASYIDVHQFIATNRKTLKKIAMNHDLIYDVTSSTFGFYCSEAKHHPHAEESKQKTLTKLREELSCLKLEELAIKFSPLESPLEWLKPRGDLDIEIMKHVKTLVGADLDWSNTSFWAEKEKDFTAFTSKNRRTLTKLRVRMTYCQDGFDCSLLQNCPYLEILIVESVLCKMKNVQFIPTSLKSLELRITTKPAQKTWIATNLLNLRYLTIEQNIKEDHPILPLLRLSRLKALTVIYCTKKRVQEMNLYCFNHAGLVLYEREDIPMKYANISNDYLDITITIDHSKYTHQLSYEDEETKNENID